MKVLLALRAKRCLYTMCICGEERKNHVSECFRFALRSVIMKCPFVEVTWLGFLHGQIAIMGLHQEVDTIWFVEHLL